MGARTLVVLASLALLACSGDDTVAVGGDAAADATIDSGPSPHDAGADSLEAASDATADAPIDSPADVAIDAPVDAPVDAAPTGVGCGLAGYPAGPYGTSAGAVIANLAFQGLVDANANGNVADDPAITICLGRYHLDPSVKVLVVHWDAAWCPPCQSEEPGWVTLAAQNAGKAAFFEAMAQNVGGQPASITSLIGWANKYKVASDLAIDPTLSLAPYFDFGDAGTSWPTHLLVRTDTMTILGAHVGAADAATVQAEIDAALATDAGAE